MTAWNTRGQPTRVVDPNGRWSPTGMMRRNLTSVAQDTAATPLTWTIAYSLAGDVTKITDPTGAYLSYTYTALVG